MKTVVLRVSIGGAFGGADSPRIGQAVSLEDGLADALLADGRAVLPVTLPAARDGYQWVTMAQSMGGLVQLASDVVVDSPRQGAVYEASCDCAAALSGGGLVQL